MKAFVRSFFEDRVRGTLLFQRINMFQTDSMKEIYRAFCDTKKEILGIAVATVAVVAIAASLVAAPWQGDWVTTGIWDGFMLGAIGTEIFAGKVLFGMVRNVITRPEVFGKNKKPFGALLKSEIKEHPIRNVLFIGLGGINLVFGAAKLIARTGDPALNLLCVGLGLACAEAVYEFPILRGALEQRRRFSEKTVATIETHLRRVDQGNLVRRGSFVEGKKRHWNVRTNFAPAFRHRLNLVPKPV
jgi:hypothetical protein